MEKRKQSRLASAGWRLGTAGESLGLSAAEATVVDLKLRLSAALRTRRQGRRLSQQELARRLGSSQSRVAKLEAADPTVSLELLLRALLMLGATTRDVAKLVRSISRRVAA
jgi:ribosome-binding protein aMBF1 (putative translation factor)